MVQMIVVYDANVLFPAPLRDLLIRLAVRGVVRAHWTDKILDECFDNLARKRDGLSVERLQRTRALMNQAVRDVLVVGYELWLPQLQLPDVDDRHVLAAAIHAGASRIVTWNLRDFPAEALAPWGVEAQDPDHFLCALWSLDAEGVLGALQEQAASLQNPPVSLEALIERLRAQGLSRFVTQLLAR